MKVALIGHAKTTFKLFLNIKLKFYGVDTKKQHNRSESVALMEVSQAAANQDK
jgi:hypothetical protein